MSASAKYYERAIADLEAELAAIVAQREKEAADAYLAAQEVIARAMRGSNE